jgi:hypothetical protein
VCQRRVALSLGISSAMQYIDCFRSRPANGNVRRRTFQQACGDKTLIRNQQILIAA